MGIGVVMVIYLLIHFLPDKEDSVGNEKTLLINVSPYLPR